MSVCAAGVPRHVDVSGIRADLLKLQHVECVEELKFWALTADKTAAIVHLQLGESLIANNNGRITTPERVSVSPHPEKTFLTQGFKLMLNCLMNYSTFFK